MHRAVGDALRFLKNIVSSEVTGYFLYDRTTTRTIFASIDDNVAAKTATVYQGMYG
jgi:hypothetical protein